MASSRFLKLYVVEFFRRDILAKKPEANTFYQKRLNKFLAQS